MSKQNTNPSANLTQASMDDVASETASSPSSVLPNSGPQDKVQNDGEVAGKSTSPRRRKLQTPAANEGNDDELSAWPLPRPKRTSHSPAHLKDFVRAIFATHKVPGIECQAPNVIEHRPDTDPVPVTDVNSLTDVVHCMSVCSLSREIMEDIWMCQFCTRDYKSVRVI